jgi:hypothetical protein
LKERKGEKEEERKGRMQVGGGLEGGREEKFELKCKFVLYNKYLKLEKTAKQNCPKNAMQHI